MKLPRDLSGADLIKLLCKHHGYRRVNQEGSHVFWKPKHPATIASQFLTTPRFASAPSTPSSAPWRKSKA